MSYFAGIDIGSTAIKVALVDEAGTLTGVHVTASGSLFHKNAKEALARLLADLKLGHEDVKYLIATGYGRKLFKEADDSISEITANAIGAHEAGKAFGGVRTIINIGGQDSKAIRIDGDGNVVQFAMNDKCAAGTGRFLEVMAAKLGVGLGDLGRLSLAAGGEVSISSVCTVFAESEVVSLVAKNHPIDQVIKGLHRSVVNRVAAMTGNIGIKPRVIMSGGVAKNAGVVALMAERLGVDIAVPEEPQIVGALGAALMAAREKK